MSINKKKKGKEKKQRTFMIFSIKCNSDPRFIEIAYLGYNTDLDTYFNVEYPLSFLP